jgi:predicted NBD/HSP70 family sugar kinase
VGIAGVTRNGRVESASNLDLRVPCDLAGRLRDVLGRPVVVVNDTQAAAVGEATSFGPGMIVLLTVGTGIGGGVVSDGRLVTGEGAAGDFGHMTVDVHGPPCVCGGRGCLEQLVSGRVLDEVARGLGWRTPGSLILRPPPGIPGRGPHWRRRRTR